MMKILFVCTGNTCRSPMAEGYFNFLARKENLQDLFSALSAGTHAFDGSPPAVEAQKVCTNAVFDISSHRSQILTRELLKEASLVLAMTADHKREILTDFPAGKGKVFTLKEFAGKEGDVRDPIGLSPAIYQEIFQEIRSSVDKIFGKLKEDENSSGK